MIFVTVGQMLGFDRFVRAMDGWAANNPQEQVFAQIGDGSYKPSTMKWVAKLSSKEFRRAARESELIVAHAGMGSFFVAMEAGKAIVMMPRHAELSEHTTDHQIHTLRWLRLKSGVFAADTDQDLPLAIEQARISNATKGAFQTYAPSDFTSRLRREILP
jgi:UDP-N-acetylglucosamine transferase subunit ALG13